MKETVYNFIFVLVVGGPCVLFMLLAAKIIPHAVFYGVSSICAVVCLIMALIVHSSGKEKVIDKPTKHTL
jgi:hypothetical protein